MMEKRNIEIKVRLNRKEADNLFKRVKRSRLSREAYLRHLINGVVPQDAPPPDYYNFSRLPASFRECNPQQIRETLTEIRDTANQISTRMYRALEQNRAPKFKEQER